MALNNPNRVLRWILVLKQVHEPMADGKKSFVLYCDQIHAFETLQDEEAGRLIKHIFKYVNDQNPQAPDRITEISFAPIKQQLKRDLKDWEKAIKAKSEGGKKSAAIRKQLKEMEDKLSMLKIVEDTTKIVEKKASNSTVNVNVNVNDINTGEKIKKMTGQDFIDFKERLKGDTIFIEPLIMNKIKRQDLDKWINSYHIHIAGEEKLEKNYIEYKRHFKNWLNKQDTISALMLLNGSVNGKTTPNYIKSENEVDWNKYKKSHGI